MNDKKRTADWITRTSGIFLGSCAALLIARGCMLTKVHPGEIGVRYSNVGGLVEKDLTPGFRLELTGLHRVWTLPSRYLYLSFTESNMFTVRTKDNNTVLVDVSIPYHIKDGEGWEVMKEGNHVRDGNGKYRFERFADRAANDTLNAVLSELSSQDFIVTDRRLAVSNEALEKLNKNLEAYHLEADAVLIRTYRFREDYEAQLASIQLNEQQKLLDDAKAAVAKKQQKLDNYESETNAQVSAKEQDWAKRLADLDRAYQVGLVDTKGDLTPGAARRILNAMPDEEKEELKKLAAKTFGKELPDIEDEHLLGIKNIEAETTEYYKRVQAESDGVKKRLEAEGKAKLAKVQADYEAEINRLLDSPAGRAYVAYEAAQHVTFDKSLSFQSGDGIPSVLRLRRFALEFMGG